MAAFFPRRTPVFIAVLFLPLAVFAAPKDDVGFTLLASELGAAMPTGAGVTVSQVEAYPVGTTNYLPNTGNAEFSGKSFTDISATGGGISNHATEVGKRLYGNSTSMSPGISQIGNYDANDWVSGGFLRTGAMAAPAVESRDIQNHSWVTTFMSGDPPAENTALNINALRRLDYTVHRDDFVAVVGLHNGASTPLPRLFSHAYNVISVGRSDGLHSRGPTGLDTAERVKPEIVAPQTATSFSTPMVGSAAALLIQKARSDSALANGAKAQAVKAILLAGATKAEFGSWDRTTTRPLDEVHGAGELNIRNSYYILAAGGQPASATQLVNSRGWDFRPTAMGGRRYFFEIPEGTKVGTFSAALTWHRIITDSPPGNQFNPQANLSDLSLRLYAAEGFTLVAEIDASLSPVDNVEHIFQQDLPAGRYALEVAIAGGHATVDYALAWDARLIDLPTVTVSATDPDAAEFGSVDGVFTVTRSSTVELGMPLTVNYALSGTATHGVDYQSLAASVTIPGGQLSAIVEIDPIEDEIVEGTESVILSIEPDTAYVVGIPSSAEIQIADRPLDDWRMDNFTAAELDDPEISGDLADPDHDGLTNLEEYAFERQPKTADTEGLPEVEVAEGYLTMTYVRRASAVDIHFVPEFSIDLLEWDDEGVEEASVVDDGDQQTVTLRSTVPVSEADRQFLRVRLEKL